MSWKIRAGLALAASIGMCIASASAQLSSSEAAGPNAIEKAKDRQGNPEVEQRRREVYQAYLQTLGPRHYDSGNVIYGVDDRIEVYDETDPNLVAMADAACVVVSTSELINNGNGTYTLITDTWTTVGGSTVCTDEPFRGQLQIGFCSGFLVGPDLITTAGHCVAPGSVDSIAFVFGFMQIDENTPPLTIIPEDNVYFGAQSIDYAQAGDLDHSVVRVDRPVVGRSPVPIRRDGVVSDGAPMTVIGHPVVLPMKIAGGAEVKNANGATGWFQSNLDTYGGNSGSMVVNTNTYVVEGILVRGAPDWDFSGSCVSSNMVGDDGNFGGGLQFEEVSKTISFSGSVPPLGMLISPAGHITHFGRVGGPFTDPVVIYTMSNPTQDPLDYRVELTSNFGILIDGGTSPITGSLGPDGQVQLTVELSAAINALPAGVYEEMIVFNDLTNLTETVRDHTVEVGQTQISVDPNGGLTSGGPLGGPFNATKDYTLTSERPTTTNVIVSASESWISLDGQTAPLEYTFTETGQNALVTIGFSTDANSLPAGIHTAQVEFLNLTSGQAQYRDVLLDVGRYVFVAEDTPLDIPDEGAVTSEIQITEALCVADVDVDMNLTHTYVGDLILDLVSPEGTVVRLHDRSGAGNDNIIARYDDDSFPPDGPGLLEDFIGESTLGTWSLHVSDNAGIDTGTLNSWSLRISATGGQCAPIAYDIAAAPQVNSIEGLTLSGRSVHGGSLDYIVTSLPAEGLLWQDGAPVLAVPQTLSGPDLYYKPHIAFTGPDSFLYKVNDGQDSLPATVSLDVGGPITAQSFPMDTDPGWAPEGDWAFGQPTGSGSHSLDPSSGYTGNNVYGYNLNGDYTNDLPPTYLTTTPIDCTGLTRVSLRFWRWLGIESSSFDHAAIDARSGATGWTQIWDHTSGSFSESAWSAQEYDISAIADGAPDLQLRWSMGQTDGSVTYPGWNIDDVQIIASVPPRHPADVNGDGAVNTLDFLGFLNAYNAGDPIADFNGDGTINTLDFLAYLNAFNGG